MNVIFDQNVYTRQPAVLTVSDWDGEAQWLKVVVRTAPSVTTWYKLPTDESTFSVNLIEVIRYLYQTASSLGEVVISSYDEDKTNVVDAAQTISFSKAGTIDPAKVLHPLSVGNIAFSEPVNPNEELRPFYPVILPSLMIRGENLARVCFEMYGYRLYDDFFIVDIDDCYYAYGINPDNYTAITTKNFTIPKADESWNDTHHNVENDCKLIVLTAGNAGFTSLLLNMQPQDCRKTYAAVEWESSFGVTRRHIFEVTKQTDNADNVIAFETVGNGWDEHKGQLCGCTLRLESLSRYDYWYYADLILSDKAKITFDGSNWYSLQVTAKGYTLPDGNDSGKLNTLEIPVNYCKYDTI